MRCNPEAPEPNDEAATLQRAESERLAALAEAAAPHLFRADAPRWLARLDAAADSITAALAWSAARGPADDANSLLARLAGSLWPYWWLGRNLTEGRRWLGMALERTEAAAPRASLLFGAGVLAFDDGDIRTARISCSELLGIGKATDDPTAETLALAGLGLVAHLLGDPQRADALGRTSLARAEVSTDQHARILALLVRGRVVLGRDDPQAANLFLRAAQASRDAELTGLQGYALLGGAYAARGTIGAAPDAGTNRGTDAAALAEAARAVFAGQHDARGLALCARFYQDSTTSLT